MIELSQFQSYFLYCSAVIFASVFAGLAQKKQISKNGENRVNPYFWSLSFLCLFLPIAFRGYGVDHGNYLKMYNEISNAGWNYFGTYSGFPEPLFVVVNMIARFLGDFQYVYIISGFISLFFTFKAFARKVNDLSLALCIWLFGTLFYLNLFGIVRMGIAVGIITYAYRYLEENNFKKYAICVIVATLFHYSALIMLPLYFIYKDNVIDRSRIKSIKKIGYSIGFFIIAFTIVGYVVIKFGDIFPTLYRYAEYFNGSSIAVINNIGGQYLLILLMLYYGREISRKEKYGRLYIGMLITMLIVIVGSIFVSFMRFTYYFYPVSYYLYSYTEKYIDNKKLRKLYIFGLIALMGLWFLFKFTSSFWGPFLIPYYIRLSF